MRWTEYTKVFREDLRKYIDLNTKVVKIQRKKIYLFIINDKFKNELIQEFNNQLQGLIEKNLTSEKNLYSFSSKLSFESIYQEPDVYEMMSKIYEAKNEDFETVEEKEMK